jgi:Na+-transporting NADH:ubiquinone oxidoreductase subunit B
MSGDEVWIAEKADAFSGATALSNSIQGDPGFSVMDTFLGFIPGSIGETSTLMILIGALILIVTGIGSWKIMFSGVVGASVMALIFNALGMNAFMDVEWYKHLFMGGLAFGLVFMATDPVTATQTEKGKWIYGFLIGFFAIMIRVFNPAYPEGIMLAILLMNVFAPLIDHYVVQGAIKSRQKRLARG